MHSANQQTIKPTNIDKIVYRTQWTNPALTALEDVFVALAIKFDV
jgi:hypothetical protein